MQSNKEIIQQFLNALAEDVKMAIPSNTLQTANKIQVEVSDNEGQITAPAWFGVFQDGRKPGTMPPVAKIEEYVKSSSLVSKIGWEGTENSLAYAIGIKMKKEGNTLYRALHGGDVNYSPIRIELDKIFSKKRIDSFAEVFAGKYQTLISSEIVEAYKA